jgi:endonuclease YncB( thermonuclease family)
MVENGYAWPYKQHARDKNYFELQKSAKSKQLEIESGQLLNWNGA